MPPNRTTLPTAMSDERPAARRLPLSPRRLPLSPRRLALVALGIGIIALAIYALRDTLTFETLRVRCRAGR
jgi:HEAT repeat protein